MLYLDKSKECLTSSQMQEILSVRDRCVSAILHSTTLAQSGHPGGSLSSLDLLLMIYAMSDISLGNFSSSQRDRVVVSHGHISPAVYSVLAEYGFFDREEMIVHFREVDSLFSGHVEHHLQGVEWSTGNLGQGLSVGCGLALSQSLLGIDRNVFVLMGDGEQQKGQIAEACRFAHKYALSNLIGIVDINTFQIGGKTQEIMPQQLEDFYRSLGWNVVLIEDGHDHKLIFEKYREIFEYQKRPDALPTVCLAKTIMGNGISFMSDTCAFHGKACSEEEHNRAFKELKLDNQLDKYRNLRLKKKKKSSEAIKKSVEQKISIDRGSPFVYGADKSMDNRSAYGKTLADLARLNNVQESENTSILGFSCDLEGSVKMDSFHKVSPHCFFEGGIQEHNTSVVAAALSKEGFQVFFSTFGVFGIDEVYNQQRLNGFNETNLKTVCTHLGLSVGEDGPTHQNIDYIGLLKNIFSQDIFIPADPNQTDRILRYVAGVYGNAFIGMGRAKTPVILTEDGDIFFGANYTFKRGKADCLRKGSALTLITYGALLPEVLKAHEELIEKRGCVSRVLNMASIAPLDEKAILTAAEETGGICVVEDHHVETGLGSLVAQVLAKNGKGIPFHCLGVDRFSSSGKMTDLYEKHGLTQRNIVRVVVEKFL